MKIMTVVTLIAFGINTAAAMEKEQNSLLKETMTEQKIEMSPESLSIIAQHSTINEKPINRQLAEVLGFIKFLEVKTNIGAQETPIIKYNPVKLPLVSEEDEPAPFEPIDYKRLCLNEQAPSTSI